MKLAQYIKLGALIMEFPALKLLFAIHARPLVNVSTSQVIIYIPLMSMDRSILDLAQSRKWWIKYIRTDR